MNRIVSRMPLYTLCSAAVLCFSSFSFSETSSSQSEARRFDNKPIDTLDIPRYMGRWYEIARFNHSFERNMVGVEARYSLLPDGSIRVENSGYKGDFDGKYKVSKGKAKLCKKVKGACLRVSFFLWFYSDYRVLMLSPDYRYALIGGRSPDYLWILSRTPSLSSKEIDLLLAEATRRGYDTSRLIWVKQKVHPM